MGGWKNLKVNKQRGVAISGEGGELEKLYIFNCFSISFLHN